MGKIIGTELPDLIFGTPFDDYIAALGGNDTIFGSTGNDTIDGGKDYDTVDYNTIRLNQSITLRPQGFVDKGKLGTDQLISVERIVAPLGFANTIDASQAGFLTSINVNLEKNSLVVNIGRNIPLQLTVENFVNVTGTANADSIVGNSNNNALTGSGGNDILVGNFGNDVLNGTDTRFRGKGEIDVLTGGQDYANIGKYRTDTDTFIIGDALGSYYKFADQLDFAVIKDFSFGERIQLGAKDTYVIAQDYSGFDIFVVTNGIKDLIADVFVQGFSIDLPKGEFQLAAGEAVGNFLEAI